MPGKIKQMIDSIIEQGSKGDPLLVKTTETKLMLKGINTNKYTFQSKDDPVIMENKGIFKSSILFYLLLFCLLGFEIANSSENKSIVFIVPTTHMDMDFTRPPSKSMDLYSDFIMQTIQILEKDKSLRYSIQIASAVKYFLEKYPEMEKRLASLVKKGRIEICANWSNPHWSELPDELMVREIAGAKWWIHDRFGVWSKIADNGELADPTPQLAQVLMSCGVPFFHSAKIMQFNNNDYKGLTGVFRYLALDGTSVLWDANFYNISKRYKIWENTEKKEVIEKVISIARTGNVSLLTAGGRKWDDALPEFENLLNLVKYWNNDDRFRAHGKFRFATFREYFEALLEESVVKDVPVWTGQTEHGELLYRWGWNKYRDRALFVNVMKDAETLASICELYGLMNYPQKKFEDLWLEMAYVSTHNWGNTDRKTREYFSIASHALKEAQEILHKCTELIAGATGGAVKINTLPLTRDDIRGIGWKKQTTKSSDNIKTPKVELENKYYKVKAKQGIGLIGIYDKKNKRELFRTQENGTILRIRSSYEEGMGAERTTIPKKLLSREEGEISNKLFKMMDAEFKCEQISGDKNSLVLSGYTGTIKCEISVRLINDRIDISFETKGKYTAPKVTIDIPEISEKLLGELLDKGPMFFASVEFDMPDDACARVSVPFGSINMPLSMPAIGDGTFFSDATAGVQSWYVAYNERWHVPLQSFVGARAATPYWLDMCDRENDFGIIWAQYAPYANMFRDGEKPTRFYKSLWRGVSDGRLYLWSFKSHKGSWQEVNAARFAEEINHPVISSQGKKSTNIKIPEKESLLQIEPENIVTTCFKKAHDGRGYILRLYESAGKSTLVSIKSSGPLSEMKFELTNIIENLRGEKISGPEIKIMMKPFEIKTLRFIP